MSYTVKQLARMAGITNRALHFYDEIGLLLPESHGDNGYRKYGETALLRLQQILFYRELGFKLEEIKTILNQPDFDLLQALEGHRQALLERAERTRRLIDTVDKTILHIKGKIKMSKLEFYDGFDEEKQKQYAEQARQRWGDSAVTSTHNWNALTPGQKNAILGELHEISQGVLDNMDGGFASPEVQYWIGRWHQAINTHFYACSLEIFEALGHMYNQGNEFTETYEKMRPGMAAFMEQAMTHYCQVKRPAS